MVRCYDYSIINIVITINITIIILLTSLLSVLCQYAGREESGRPRQGYMGHLTRIANHLVNSSGADGVGDSSAATSALLLGTLSACTLSVSRSISLFIYEVPLKQSSCLELDSQKILG